MKTIVVTGGSGKAGRAVLRELREHGYHVVNVDLVRCTDIAPCVVADLTQLGQAYDVLLGADAVVHLAAIPGPGRNTADVTFKTNLDSTYNIFSAAVALGLKRVVWASSETTLGLPFERAKPAYAPLDEDHPLLPETSYALSKVLGEEMARQIARWSGIPFVGLRFSNIMEPDDYARFPSFWTDARVRKWNLWGYVDARDVAQSCRLALQADLPGGFADHFIIAAGDTCMNRPSRELLKEVFPQVPLRGDVGEFDTLLSIAKARRVLGYAPEHSWRHVLNQPVR